MDGNAPLSLVVLNLEHSLSWQVAFPAKEHHHMTTPERIQARHHHRQIFDDKTVEQTEPQRETAWVNDFILRLTSVLRNIGSKK